MGMYDSIHTLQRCGQVKCWGQSLGDWTIGCNPILHVGLEDDEMTLILDLARQPDQGGRTDEQIEADERALSDGRRSDLGDYLVLMSEGFLVVRDHEFVDWTDERIDGLLLVDSFGRDVATTAHRVITGASYPVSECHICSPPDLSWMDELDEEDRTEISREARHWLKNLGNDASGEFDADDDER